MFDCIDSNLADRSPTKRADGFGLRTVPLLPKDKRSRNADSLGRGKSRILTEKSGVPGPGGAWIAGAEREQGAGAAGAGCSGEAMGWFGTPRAEGVGGEFLQGHAVSRRQGLNRFTAVGLQWLR